MFLLLSLLSGTILNAQDFLGARTTGKHTTGVSVIIKSDGLSFAAGYNHRAFKGPLSKPIDINILAEVPLKKNNSWSISTSANQVYQSNNKVNGGFGVGAQVKMKMEFCPIIYKNSPLDCGTKLTTSVGIKPGLFNIHSAICTSIELDVAKFNMFCGHLEESRKTEILQKGHIGIQTDFVNTKSGNGKLHFSGEGNIFFRRTGGKVRIRTNPADRKTGNNCFGISWFKLNVGTHVRI